MTNKIHLKPNSTDNQAPTNIYVALQGNTEPWNVYFITQNIRDNILVHKTSDTAVYITALLFVCDNQNNSQ